MDKGFLYIDDIDAYALTAKGLDYVDAFEDFLEDQRAQADGSRMRFRASGSPEAVARKTPGLPGRAGRSSRLTQRTRATALG